MIKRPIPDEELLNCTRDELYNRIYSLRETKDALQDKLDAIGKMSVRFIEAIRNGNNRRAHTAMIELDILCDEWKEHPIFLHKEARR